MKKLLGANWWTTLWGGIATVCGAIAVKPEILAFLPDQYESTVANAALFVTVVSGGVFAHGVKSKEVTGGTVQQTVSGAPAMKGTQDMVDLTVQASKESGEVIPPELHIPPPN